MSLTSADLLQQKKLNLHEGEQEPVLFTVLSYYYPYTIDEGIMHNVFGSRLSNKRA